MFTKFAIAYRHLWHKEFQETRYREFAKKEWEKQLQNYSDEIINKVTEICEQKFEMPPTMAQFIGLCRNESNRNFFVKKEEVKRAHPDTAAHYLKKMKDILNKRR